MQAMMSGARIGAVRRFINLLGTASFATLAGVAAAEAQPAAPVEEVLITGSLITGSAAIGVPVTALGAEDFRNSGALTVTDVLRTLPSIQIAQFDSGAASGQSGERTARVLFRTSQLGAGGARAMLLVNNLRYPGQGIGGSLLDPGIIPEIAIERVEVLTDGASSVYGSDAVAGVINIILKHGFDGATTQVRYGTAISGYGGGMDRYQFGQNYGRTWDGGSIMVAYEFSEQGTLDRTADRLKYQFTADFTPWGLDDREGLDSAMPGIVTNGAPTDTSGIAGPRGCTNCFSIPKGTGWDFGTRAPGSTISWAELLTHPGTENLVNSYAQADLTSRSQRNSAALTFNQRILNREILGGMIKGATLDVHAFYSNRRSVYFTQSQSSSVLNHNRGTFRPPTSNPYYPAGAPAGLRVAYSFTDQLNPRLVPFEIARRWGAQVEAELPSRWLGRINYSVSDDYTGFNQEGVANTNMVSAALGNTVASVAANVSTPGQAAFTKPANVPYLNVFCDGTAHQCNSPVTLAYISSYRHDFASHQLHEWNAQFDGPLFMLPGGEVRAALGAQLRSRNFSGNSIRTDGSPNTSIITTAPAVFAQQIPAFYAQLNVPIFSDMNAISLFERLELQVSVRQDHYYDFGSIANPKISGEWSPGFGLTFRGSWGKSFRAPGLSDLAASGSRVRGLNALGGDVDLLRACPVGSSTPVPGSAGERLVKLGLASCNGIGAPLFPGGLEPSVAAWPPLVGLFRPAFGTGPAALEPEKATTASYGFSFDPDIPSLPFLSGLHLDASYWRVEVSNLVAALAAGSELTLLDTKFANLVITPDTPGGDFNTMIKGVLASPASAGVVANASNIVFLMDGARRNLGKLVDDGYDFAVRYDYDTGDLGVFSSGISGTYYRNEIISSPAAPTIDNFHTDASAVDLGVNVIPRLKWRARLGWTDGTWNANVSATYFGHYYTTQPLTTATAQFPNWSNIVPSNVSVDLSLAYNTGTIPANEYLQNINLQLVVNDVFDKKTPFVYFLRRGNNSAFDGDGNGISPVGRYVTFTVTKNW